MNWNFVDDLIVRLYYPMYQNKNLPSQTECNSPSAISRHHRWTRRDARCATHLKTELPARIQSAMSCDATGPAAPRVRPFAIGLDTRKPSCLTLYRGIHSIFFARAVGLHCRPLRRHAT